MGFTHSYSNAIINVASGRTRNVDIGGTIHLGLSTTQPNADGTGVSEPSGNGYARVLIGKYDEPTSYQVAAAANGAAANNRQIAFNKATGAWPTCNYACLFAGSTLIWFGPLTNPVTLSAGEVALIEASDLTLEVE